jgi:hypothetical protein
VNVRGISLAGGSGRKADEVLAGIEAVMAPACLRRRLIAEMVKGEEWVIMEKGLRVV